MKSNLDSLALTRELLSFNTINPPGREHDCALYIGKLLEGAGYKVRFFEFEEKRTSLVACNNGTGNKPPICFSGHVDTVPLGAADWTKDPFAGECEGDRIYGRGSSDMKAGVASMVIAALGLASCSGGKAGIMLVVTADEETGCQGASYLAASGHGLEKAGAVIVGEPTSNYPMIAHKGALWLEAGTTGVAAHGSMPEHGVNAIYKAVQAVTRLRQFEFNVSAHPLLGEPTLNVGTISGGLNINSVPDKTTIGIDIRTIPGQSNQEVYECLQAWLGEEVELRKIVSADCVATDPQHEWVQQVFDIMEPFLKERPVARGMTYFTDASVLTPALGHPPTMILGPGDPIMAHQTDEFCRISNIESAAEAYFEIAKKWCGI